MSATVTVRGTAVINAQPDEVELDLSVSYLDRTAEAALAEVIKRSATLEEILSELSIDRACWTTTGAPFKKRPSGTARKASTSIVAIAQRTASICSSPTPNRWAS